MRFVRGDVRAHCFPQKRPRTIVLALKCVGTVEASKNQLSRDFWYRSIFDFCNSIGTKRTWRDVRLESAMRTKADVRRPL